MNNPIQKKSNGGGKKLQPQKIGLYIADILYNIGGTESYTVKLCNTLQNIYKDARFYFVSECYKNADFTSSKDFIESLNKKYGSSLLENKVEFIPIKAYKKNKIGRILLRKRLEKVSKKFDLFFYCSRGNYVFKAKKNIHIIHFPTKPIAVQKSSSLPLIKWYESFKDKNYIKTYDLFLANSEFTQRHFLQIWKGIDDKKINSFTKVLYPAVCPVAKLSEIKKEKIILVLSRIEKSKNLETLIDAYKSSIYLNQNYRMIIAGGLIPSLKDYHKELQNRAENFNIDFIVNASFEKITELYNRALIFWHCKGFGIDENKVPELMEHFGMSTVEAMSAGCIPIVINEGGQKEIVDESCGYKWKTTEELITFTEEIAKDKEKQNKLSLNAIKKSQKFTINAFEENLRNILKEIWN